MSTFQDFKYVCQRNVADFRSSHLICKVDNHTVCRADYVELLKLLFFQVREGPSSFALAGANCENDKYDLREYLFKHAEEEKTHWRWVLNDLRQLGEPDDWYQHLLPTPAVASYIAFNFYTAHKMPVARLAIAMVLEGIASVHGPSLGGKLASQLGLTVDEMTFFSSHAVTDAVHSVEIDSQLSDLDLTRDEWRRMAHTADTAGTLYRNIYDSVCETTRHMAVT